MTVIEAIAHVNAQLARIERENPVGVLKPWEPDACPAALEHWGLTQQKLALNSPHPQNRFCCDGLHLDTKKTQRKQKTQ